MTEVRLRRARPEDADRLTEVALAAKRHWGYPEDWVEEWREGLTFSPAFVESHIVTVATDPDDTPVALYALIGDSPEIQLEHVWVNPASMGRGIGRRLVEHAADTARSLGADALLINSDPNAEPFYLRMGAVTVGSLRADVCGEHRELPQMRLDLGVT